MVESHEIITVDGIRYIRIPELLQAGLNHVFTTIDLNMRPDGSEMNRRFAENLEKIYQALEIEPSQFYFMEQEHSDWVSIVDEKELGRRYPFGHRAMGIDALVTSRKYFVLCTTVADCAPVLLFDPVKKVQANIHSGWKGTLAKIVSKAVKNLVMRYQTDPADIIVGIGPHIERENYEIQDDVVELFYGGFANYEEIIFKDENGKRTLDLRKAIASCLVNDGVREENIFYVGLSTFAENELLHSYRRDGEDYGANSAVSSMMMPGEIIKDPEEDDFEA
ncbi:MAG TPA: polyphenol oxidase family protein [Clostridiaceae bacterium]|nr:polyphenol oxidase family protein [Clostridiaceae bacterium]